MRTSSADVLDHVSDGSKSSTTSPHYQEVLSPLVSESSVAKKNTSRKNQQRKCSTRALKACNSCRKQKTRCFPSYNSIGCLRCSSVGLICSFEEEAILNNGTPTVRASPINDSTLLSDNKPADLLRQHPMIGPNAGNGLVDARLKMLQNDVSEILNYLKKRTDDNKTIENDEEDANMLLNVSNPSNVIPLTDVSRVKLFQYSNSIVDLNNLPSFGVPSSSFKASPFKTYIDMCASVNNKPVIGRFLKDESKSLLQTDIVTLGLLSLAEALNLLQNFRDRYGRWVSFPDNLSTDNLLMNLRSRGSLLLTTCCCLSLKYGNASLKKRIYFQLFERLKVELKESIVHIPQTIEFLQSLVALSMYGITLSTAELGIDSWYMSGIGLQQFISKDMSGQLLSPENIPSYYDSEFYELTIHRIWNHLSLCHIVYCLYTGRMCIIDELRLNFSRKILELSNSTNFDGRIVAEISSQLIVYNFIQFSSSQQSLQLVKDELKGWFDQWNYLFDQPANQFVELGYHYGYLLILYNWNYMKHKTRDDSEEILLNADSISIRSMIFHCQKILDAMLDTPNDSYFAFLSDQVHFTANFGIMMLMRILHVINLENYNNGNDDLNKVEMSKNELHKNLSRCLSLSERYKKISTGGSDIYMKYHLTISDTLTQLFHDFIK